MNPREALKEAEGQPGGGLDFLAERIRKDRDLRKQIREEAEVHKTRLSLCGDADVMFGWDRDWVTPLKKKGGGFSIFGHNREFVDIDYAYALAEILVQLGRMWKQQTT
jgi:hypothetical protein